MNNPQSWTEVIRLSNPAAASGRNYLIDSRAYRRILTVKATFAADANVASRFPSVQFKDGDGTVFAEFAASLAIAATETFTLTWARVGDHVSGSGSASSINALPDLLLPPGYTVTITASSMQAGDQFSNISLMVENHPSGNYGIPSGARPYEMT